MKKRYWHLENFLHALVIYGTYREAVARAERMIAFDGLTVTIKRSHDSD